MYEVAINQNNIKRKDASQQNWLRRLNELQTERSSFDTTWNTIATYMAPRRYRRLEHQDNKGTTEYDSIVDETVLRARSIFVAGFVSGMTSPVRPWFKLRTEDEDLMEHDPVKVWLEDVEQRMRVVLSKSNFYQAIADAFDDVGTFGTCSMTCLEDRTDGCWFMSHLPGTFYLSTNIKGLVDTFYREVSLSTRQLVERFGNRVSRQIMSCYEAGDLDTRHDVVQAIEPNHDRESDRGGWRGMAWRSVWFEKQAGDGNFLGQGGFHEFPVHAARWMATISDDYGIDCPGMRAIGGSKQLQHEQKKKGQAIDLMVRPPLQAPSSLEHVLKGILPGGLTFYDETTPNSGLRPVYEVQPRLIEMLDDIRAVQQRLNEAFFVDMFLMISEQDDVRTATEIALRNEEKLLVLGPTLQRVQTELLDPTIERLFATMYRQGVIPDPPEELEGQPVKVKYVSMLAQAQQSVGAASIERFVGAVGNMSAIHPEILDKVDFDAVADEYGEILGIPSRLIRPDDEVEDIREARAQQIALAQAQQAADVANTGAQAAKAASEIDVGEDSAFQRLSSGV